MASTELKIVAEGDCTKEGLETLIRESGIVRGQTILVLFLDGLEFGRWALTNTGHLCLSRETAAKFWSDEALVAENH